MLTQEQQRAHDLGISFLEGNAIIDPVLHTPKEYVTIGGYAGTGKTYVITEIAKTIKQKWKHYDTAFVTYTGKASSILRQRLYEQGIYDGSDYIGTIHSLIYKPKTVYNKILHRHVVVGWRLKDDITSDFILIDEASMVSKSIWEDLLSFNKPIIAVGDHGQLPPVGDNFKLLSKPDYELKTVHRQAEHSPIIALSKFIRENGYIPKVVISKKVFKLEWGHPDCNRLWDSIDFDESVVALCGFNYSRVNLNKMIRKRINFNKPDPYPGERIICLKNNRETKIMNGQLGTILWLMPYDKNTYRITIQFDGTAEPYEGIVHDCCFNKAQYEFATDKKDPDTKELLKHISRDGFHSLDYFDFGYSTSVHKSQGSEWSKVVLFEQRSQYWDDEYYQRWLYTAVTRAIDKLFIISGFY